MLILLLLEFGITIIKVTCRLRIALCYRKYKTKSYYVLSVTEGNEFPPTTLHFAFPGKST